MIVVVKFATLHDFCCTVEITFHIKSRQLIACGRPRLVNEHSQKLYEYNLGCVLTFHIKYRFKNAFMIKLKQRLQRFHFTPTTSASRFRRLKIYVQIWFRGFATILTTKTKVIW